MTLKQNPVSNSQSRSKPRLAIVIPAYNEEFRLPATLENLRRLSSQADFPWDLQRVLVVNDGSLDHTRRIVEQTANEWSLLRALDFQKNMGKGAAVFAGLDALSLNANVEWILVADADEATPWTELVPLVTVASEENFLVFGSRRHAGSRIEHRQEWWRERMGRIFNVLLRTLTGLPFRDTQCGFKLLRTGPRLERILNAWTVARFAWDAELILHAHHSGLKCLEFPIEWRHVAESRVHPLRDGVQMASEIIRIRLKQSVTIMLNKEAQQEWKISSAFRQSINNQIIP